MNKEELIKEIDNFQTSDNKILRSLENRTYEEQKAILIYYIEKNGNGIYSQLSEEFRKDPEILKIALEKRGANPLKHALPEAITKENIFLGIDRNKITQYQDSSHAIHLLESGILANRTYEEQKAILIYYIEKNDSGIYSQLSEEFRKDPEILKIALEKSDTWTNPLKHALPEAITKENIFLGIDRNKITQYQDSSHAIHLLESGILANRTYEEQKAILIYYIEKNDSGIYSQLSEEFRKDPEMLKLALEKSDVWANPLKYALPEAITKENIFLGIDRNKITQYQDSSHAIHLLESGILANRTYEEQKAILIYYIEKNDSGIYSQLSEEFRKDPEILKIALEKSDVWANPLKHALPEAITKENIFLGIDRNKISHRQTLGTSNIDLIKSNLLTNMSYEEQKAILIYYIEKKGSGIYTTQLPIEFRKEPEILKVAIEYDDSFSIDFVLTAASEEAITNEIIDLLVKKEKNVSDPRVLKNKYYILQIIEKKPNIISKIPKELREEPDIQALILVFNPSFVQTIGTNSLNEYMQKYAQEYGLEINEKNIVNIILSDNSFVQRTLALSPKIYTLLSKEQQKNEKNIYTILTISGKNLIYVPKELITDDMIELALLNGYELYKEHYEIIYNYFNNKIKNNPKSIFNLFLNIKEEGLELVLLQNIVSSRIEKPDEVEEKIKAIITKYAKKYKALHIEEKYIIDFMTKIYSGEICALNLKCVLTFEDIVYATNLGNLFKTNKSESNHLRPMSFNSISYDMLTKTNSKEYQKIKQLLLGLGMDDFTASRIGLKAYSSIGYIRLQDLLTGKYGPVNIELLENLFGALDCSEVIYEPNGNKYKPVLNETLINLLFGTNYKVKNTPIRNYLSKFSEMQSQIDKQIEKIKANSDLTDEDKKARIAEINQDYSNYCSNIREFISNLNYIFINWDIIEEEFLKKQTRSKLNIKLNINQINEIVSNIKNVRLTIAVKKGFSKKEETRYRRIPNYQPQDYPLIKSDVFDYVGIQTQYTTNPEMAPARAVELSRMMTKSTKKFPNVNLKYDKYKIGVLNPQDRNLISCGYRSGCCFRPNGNADNEGRNNSLLTYCCATEYGGGIEIKDSDGKTLMFSPILRNGNVLMIHSFESLGLTLYEKEIANNLLYNWAKEVIAKSQQEEKGKGIVAVAISDLHAHFDKSFSQATLQGNKKFRIYDPKNQFNGMYHNLRSNNHHVIAFAPYKNVTDIEYDQEVTHSYQYPHQYIEIKQIEVTDEQLELVNQYEINKETIIKLANERKDHTITKEEKNEKLKEIKRLKKENLLLQKEIYSKTPNANRDVLTDYLEGLEKIQEICDELKQTRKNKIYKFTKIIYSDNWYLGITTDGKLYGDCIKGFEQPFLKALTDIKNSYGIDLELEYAKNFNNNYKKPQNGGPRI